MRSLGIDVGVEQGAGPGPAGRTPGAAAGAFARARDGRGARSSTICTRRRSRSIHRRAGPRRAGRAAPSRSWRRLNIQSFNTPRAEHGDGEPVLRLDAGRVRGVHGGGGRRGSPPTAPGARRARPRSRSSRTPPRWCWPARCRPPGCANVPWREAVLRAQGVRTDELGSQDRIDAALAALTGLLVARRQAIRPGRSIRRA